MTGVSRAVWPGIKKPRGFFRCTIERGKLAIEGSSSSLGNLSLLPSLFLTLVGNWLSFSLQRLMQKKKKEKNFYYFRTCVYFKFSELMKINEKFFMFFMFFLMFEGRGILDFNSRLKYFRAIPTTERAIVPRIRFVVLHLHRLEI